MSEFLSAATLHGVDRNRRDKVLSFVSSGGRPLEARPKTFLPMAETPNPPQTFEAAIVELENILATMEGGQLPLAETLAAHRRGAELLRYCQAALKDAQQQVEVLERGVLKAFAAEGGNAQAGTDGP